MINVIRIKFRSTLPRSPSKKGLSLSVGGGGLGAGEETHLQGVRIENWRKHGATDDCLELCWTFSTDKPWKVK